MKILLIAVLIFAVQPAQTKNSERAAKPKTAQRTQDAQATNSNGDKAQNPSVSVTVNANSPPNTEQSKDDDGENMRVQRRLVLFTGLLVLVGILTAAFIGWQSLETRRSARAAKESAAAVEKQLPLLQKAADAAEQSAEAAKQNIELFISKERARLRVDMKRVSSPCHARSCLHC